MNDATPIAANGLGGIETFIDDKMKAADPAKVAEWQAQKRAAETYEVKRQETALENFINTFCPVSGLHPKNEEDVRAYLSQLKKDDEVLVIQEVIDYCDSEDIVSRECNNIECFHVYRWYRDFRWKRVAGKPFLKT